MYRIYFLIGLSLFFNSSVFGQNIDSLKMVLPTVPDTSKVIILQEIAYAIIKQKPDSSIALFEQSLKLARDNKQYPQEVEAYSGMAYGYEIINDSSEIVKNYHLAISTAENYGLFNDQANQHLYFANHLNKTTKATKAIEHYNKAIQLFELTRDTIQIITAYMRLANSYDVHGEYVEALKKNIVALDLASAIKDTVGESQVFNNMAIIYKKQNNSDEALKYYHRSLDLLKNTKHQSSVAVTKVNIALIYKDRNKLDTAMYLMHESMNHFKKIDDIYSLCQVYHNVAVVHRKGNNLDSAIYYLNQSQTIAEKINFQKTKIKNNLEFAKIYQKKKDFNKALAHVNKSVSISNTLGSLEDQRESYELQYKIFEDQKNIPDAFKVLKQFLAVNDSIFNDSKKQEIGFLKTSFELKQKEGELAMLEQKSQIENLNKQNERNWKYLLIFGVIGLSTICVMLMVSRNNKIKANKLLQQKSSKIEFQHTEIELQKKKLLDKNQRLKKLNKDKNQLIGMVAHDLRSPLNQIKGLINILKLTSDLSNEGDGIINKINRSTDRLREMINRTLDLKAIETNQINLHKETFDFQTLVTSVCDNFYDMAANKGITLERQHSTENSFVYADKNYTVQIIENLISNAIKFSPHKSKVVIKVHIENELINLTVSDDGPGINEEDKKNLFKPYQKLSAKPTNNEDSTGLGLAIVKKYVEVMGGTVKYQDNKSRGASFVVAFNRVMKQETVTS